MIDTDKYEGHTPAPWRTAEGQPYDDEGSHLDIVDANGVLVTETSYFTDNDHPNTQLIADAPLLLEFIQKIVKDWCKPNQCNQAFGKDVRQLMYEYGLITFNEETRRYEVKE